MKQSLSEQEVDREQPAWPQVEDAEVVNPPRHHSHFSPLALHDGLGHEEVGVHAEEKREEQQVEFGEEVEAGFGGGAEVGIPVHVVLVDEDAVVLLKFVLELVNAQHKGPHWQQQVRQQIQNAVQVLRAV